MHYNYNTNNLLYGRPGQRLGYRLYDLWSVCWQRSEVYLFSKHSDWLWGSREEIEYYVDAFRPMDKAGAYAIQEWIGHVGIERIEGSFYNVMGLPIQTIYTKLNEIIV